jgi:hypothetical protein
LYGQNTATYKIALAHALNLFVESGRDRVSLDELSDVFLTLYVDRLVSDRPQLSSAGRQTKMERIVHSLRGGVITRSQAVDEVGRTAFVDVIPRFHVLPDGSTPPPFYIHQADGGLILTDAAFRVLERSDAPELLGELNSRWDLLEAAFALKREPGSLAIDIRQIYLEQGSKRRSVTSLAPVLRGYQEARCFYCGEIIPPNDGHVDHVIPRQIIHHDHPWNLVLAHGFCNLSKSDRLPGRTFIEQLIGRNEALIASNHPLRQHLIERLGQQATRRRRFIETVYSDAKVIMPWEWTGLPGFEPATSDFYKALIRGMTR